MPRVVIPYSNTNWTIDRPLILSVVKDISEIMRVSSKTPISFYGDENKSAQLGSTIGDIGIGDNLWPYDERLFIEVTEQIDQEQIYNSIISGKDHCPVFLDENLEVEIKPVYKYSKVTITVKYRVTDKNKALMWQRDLAVRASMLRSLNVHTVEIGYGIPNEFLSVIEEIHRLRESVAGYGETLGEYFINNLNSNTSFVTALDGQDGVWLTKERQSGIQGYFDFPMVPDKPEKEGEHDVYIATSTYNFEYRRPTHAHIQYPLMVHQQLIDTPFRPDSKMKGLYDKPHYFSQRDEALFYFSSDKRRNYVRDYQGIRIPDIDDFVIKNQKITTVNVFTAMVAITAQDRKFLLNLKDIGDFNLTADIIKFLSSSEYAFVTKAYQSIIQLDLWIDNDLAKPGSITVDSDLNVYASYDLDLRCVYHLQMSLVTNISYLPIVAISRLQNNPDVAEVLVGAINAAIRGFNGSRADINKHELSQTDVTLLTTKQLSPAYMRGHYPHFVGSLIVDPNLKNK